MSSLRSSRTRCSYIHESVYSFKRRRQYHGLIALHPGRFVHWPGITALVLGIGLGADNEEGARDVQSEEPFKIHIAPIRDIFTPGFYVLADSRSQPNEDSEESSGNNLTLIGALCPQRFENMAIALYTTTNEYFLYLFGSWDCSRTKLFKHLQIHLRYMYATGPRRQYSTRSFRSTGRSFRPNWPAMARTCRHTSPKNSTSI